MSVDYSIESALPYTEGFENKQQLFEEAFQKFTGTLTQNGKSFARCLLVDDVTGNPNTDLDEYTKISAGGNCTVFRESMLTGLNDELFEQLGNNDPDIKTKLKADSSYTSSFYITVWLLVRLGHLTHPDFPTSQIAHGIMNILPKEWCEGESESLEIIQRSPYASAVRQVEYTYL